MQRINSDSITTMFSGDGADLYRRIEEYVSLNEMDGKIKQGVLLGLSGGADSVMLLCFLIEYRNRHELKFPIVAVHVNHNIRGDEADRDEDFCKQLCDSLDIEFISVAKDVPGISAKDKKGIEETAREVRYSAFEDIISGRDDIYSIAVAHNLTDSAETVLLNLLRGSGSRGGSGIRPIRGMIIRPLLGISKKDIVSSLDRLGFPYVNDSTNESLDYSRNYIRHEILPLLSKISDDPEGMIARFAANLHLDNEFIYSLAKKFLDEHQKPTNKELRALDYPLFVRVLTEMAGYQGGLLPASLTRDIYGLLAKDNFRYSLYADKSFICERGICSVGVVTGDFEYHIEAVFGVNTIKEIVADVIISNKKLNNNYLNVYKKSIQADLSSAIIEGSLYLRPKIDGDTIYYGGMTHKLKKLFNDRKIPLSIRKSMPILCDDRGVVWVPGFGVRDDGVKCGAEEVIYVTLGYKEYNE